MKYDMMYRGLAFILGGIVKKAEPDRKKCSDIKHMYREIVERAADIGKGNRLQGAYAFAAWFIAMNRCRDASAEENCRIMEDGLRNSRLYRAFMGSADSYFSEKNMKSRREWSKETYERKYANDWVVDVIEGNGDFVFGFDYRECGVCKLCRDEGCPELAKYLCSLDYMTTDMMGVHLERTRTLAEGGDCCDFRFSR